MTLLKEMLIEHRSRLGGQTPRAEASNCALMTRSPVRFFISS